MDHPLDDESVDAAVKQAVSSGRGLYTGHARKRMRERGIAERQCRNVLVNGFSGSPEHENGRWRYRKHGLDITVVFQIVDVDQITIVTAWRDNR